MKVLSVASELFPLVKTGGLADVTGALPLALTAIGVEMRSLLPAYPAVKASAGKTKLVTELHGLPGGSARLLSASPGGLDLLLLDNPALYDRPGGIYADEYGTDHPDNWRRFAALSKAAAMIAAGAIEGYRPDLVHAHDWQAALTPAYLRYENLPQPTVMTVHNLAFQGQFPALVFAELGLPQAAFAVDGIEYYGSVGFLKGGLQCADAITTVSPTYAKEIRSQEYGMGLDGLLRARSSHVHGIINGIDTAIWDPEEDPALAMEFSARNLKNRQPNRRAVEERFSLAREDDTPVLTVISRLTWQKGIDILADGIDAIIGTGARLAVLGSGDRALEGALLAAQSRHPGRIGVQLGYDEPLSHLLQAGSDAILVPSRFEPCGLTQLYGLRYGCVPIVSKTGGLADTVIDANMAAVEAGVATGFQFSPVNREALIDVIARATEMFADRRTWMQLQRNGMKSDVSWAKSAASYSALYQNLIAGKSAA